MTEILKIADLVEDPGAPRWVEYPGLPGFELHLRQPDIPAVTRMVGQAAIFPAAEPEAGEAASPLAPGKKKKKDKKRRQGPPLAVDWIDYHYRFLRYAVDGWRGLKVKHLAQLIPDWPLKAQGADPDAALGFCPENLEFLISKVPAFSKWLSEYVSAWNGEVEEREEADNENLSATPNTLPTPSR